MLGDHFLFVNIRASFFRFHEAFRIIIRYYTRGFFFNDLLLSLAYSFKNPYRVSKSFLKSIGKPCSNVYGETPLTTLHTIVKEFRILSKDVVYELGCGRGRTLFWLRHFVKCRAVGIDFVPTFIQKANRIKRLLKMSGVLFLEKDMTKIDFSEATVIYLYGTCLEEEMIEKLILKFSYLKKETKIITVSYPLSDYSPLFKTKKRILVNFPWGYAEVFLQNLI